MCISSLSSWISGPHEGQWSRGSHGTARAELGSRGLCHHPARSTMPGTRVASGTSLRMRVGQGQARMWLCSEEWVSSPAMVLLGQGLMGWGDWHGTLGHKQVAETQGSVGTARWPWDPGAGWSVFLSHVFWKNIYFCQVPCYSGDMKWCRIQFLLHYWIFKKLKEQTNTSL